MLCDQDDVWHPDKIEKTLSAMRKARRGMVKKRRSWFILIWQVVNDH